MNLAQRALTYFQGEVDRCVANMKVDSSRSGFWQDRASRAASVVNAIEVYLGIPSNRSKVKSHDDD
jgi:hypothetical protein